MTSPAIPSSFLGFGKESMPGVPTMSKITIPVLGPDEECCAICGRIGKTSQMHAISDSYWIYVCHRKHGKPKSSTTTTEGASA